MTYATDLGFVVGEKYVVVTGTDDVSRGEILTFLDDDNSINPYFERRDGEQVCPYLSAFMCLSQKGVKSEISADSVEDSIQKRNEAKDALIKAQQELDEKLEFLGLQEINNVVTPKQAENFEWVEAPWTKFSVGDEIKAISNYSDEVYEGVVRVCEGENYSGDMVLAIYSSEAK